MTPLLDHSLNNCVPRFEFYWCNVQHSFQVASFVDLPLFVVAVAVVVVVVVVVVLAVAVVLVVVVVVLAVVLVVVGGEGDDCGQWTSTRDDGRVEDPHDDPFLSQIQAPDGSNGSVEK